MANPPALEIRLLGGFRVAVAGQAVPDSVWRQKRAAAIVKLLALEPSHRLHREQVIDALWPERDPDAAANNLRVALHHARQGLRAAGAEDVLAREGETISLGLEGVVRVDVDTFNAAIGDAWRSSDPALSHAALAAYGGDLLPEDPYEDWAAGPRAALRASYLTLLRRLAALHEQRGEIGQAIAACQRSLAADPLDEETHLALMRLYALAGQPQRAAEQFDTLSALLARELGAEPQPATRALLASVREGRFPEAIRPLEPPDEAEPVITARPRGLPAPVDALIGREREEAELRHLLTRTRLLTLSGPGGVGKTRLALAVAWGAAADFPDGVAFADLAALDDAALVLPAIAAACGAREEAGHPLLETLIDQLGGRRFLLVVDNMEHVLAAAPRIGALLAACPQLTVLATSRGRLRLQGEQEYPVPPLAVSGSEVGGRESEARGLGHLSFSPKHALPPTADLRPPTPAPAVELFVRRAKAARPDFVLDAGGAAAVAEICRRLDGLPLAIELAAARVRLLPPAELLAQLERPLMLLTGGPRDAPARQRTLRATIAWSHDLLSAEEQDLFARLSVFRGGWTQEAAEYVGGDGFASGGDAYGLGGVGPTGLRGEEDEGVKNSPSSLPSAASPPKTVQRSSPPERSISPSTLDLLGALIDQSLVRQAPGVDGESRFAMLETIREFAREQLEFSSEMEGVRRRHGAHFMALAEEAAPELKGPDQARWLERLAAEHDNLRQALNSLHEGEDVGSELRLAAALWRFWWQRGFLSEGRQRLEQALTDGVSAGKAIRAAAHDGAGALAEAQGDLAAAALHHEAALVLWRELGDRRGEARALIDFGIVADKMGDAERAVALFTEALAIARAAGDREQLAAGLANLGFVSLDRGDHQRAAAAFTESLTLLRDLGDQRNLSYVLGGLGILTFAAGDYAGAAAMQEESLRVLRELGDRQGMADALADLGHAVQRQGNLERAAALYGEALQHYHELGDLSGAAFVLTHLGRLHRLRGDAAQAGALLREGVQLAWRLGETPMVSEALEGLASLACDEGEATRCAHLLGTAEALREATGIPLPAVHEPEMAQNVAIARAALGDTGFAAARGAGRALSPEQALFALDGGRESEVGGRK